MQYITKNEEDRIKQILDSLAVKYKLKTKPKEFYVRKSSYYLDRLWWVETDDEKIVPAVAFEIEKGLPNEERLKGKIFSLACSRASLGYIILPHRRIMNSRSDKHGWVKWYRTIHKKSGKIGFFRVFCNYVKLFPTIQIRLADADDILNTKALKTLFRCQ